MSNKGLEEATSAQAKLYGGFAADGDGSGDPRLGKSPDQPNNGND
jgi:hypothetical protein